MDLSAPIADGEFDPTQSLDTGPWGRYQKIVLVYAALALAVDGLANQVLGLAIPALIKDWNVPRSNFATVAALGLIGVAIGAAVGGVLGDRFGRRPALIGSVVLFGAMTVMTGTVHGLTELTALRFLAGLGLGSTLPNATAMVVEYTPARHRSLAVSLGMVCIPLGSLVSGVIAAKVLPAYGWRAFFVVGGILPLILGAVLAASLPESPRFLLGRSEKQDRLKIILHRIGVSFAPDARLVDRSVVRQKAPAAALFDSALRRSTLALWASFFFCLMALYTVFSWGPAMLAAQGFDLAATSIALAAFNTGGIAGALFSAWLINRLGSYWAAVGLGSFAVLGAAALAVIPINASAGMLPLIATFTLESLFLGGFQNVLYPTAAFVYPASARATGVGAAAAIGRIGAVVSSFSGIIALEWGGASTYFGCLAAVILAAVISVTQITKHVPPLR